MIEVQKNYVLTLTEQQARELYYCLSHNLSPKDELMFVYDELKKHFGKKDDFDYQTYIKDYK